MENAFIQNRTTKSDQLSKLREVLRGSAKKLLPESTIKTIDDAWADLEKAFGDVERVMNYRKKAIMNFGSLPQHNSKGGYKAQVEWYLQLEGLVRGMQELGRKDPKLALEAFSPSTIKIILRMFPHNLQNKLVECPGWGDPQLEAIIEMIVKFRSKSQDLQKLNDDNTCSVGGDCGEDYQLHQADSEFDPGDDYDDTGQDEDSCEEGLEDNNTDESENEEKTSREDFGNDSNEETSDCEEERITVAMENISFVSPVCSVDADLHYREEDEESNCPTTHFA